jgi:cytochrome c551/c552
LQYTLTKVGDYPVSVEVVDDKKASSTSNPVDVYAGNAAPTVLINIEGNKSFYFPGKPVKYNVKIEDADDPSTKDLNNLVVSANYSDQRDKAGTTQGDQALAQQMVGQNLMLSLDCKGCHKVDTKSVGPAFIQVSQRYQKNPQATATLAEKIISGGSGNWGKVPMAAHPNLKESDAKEIVSWILSLANENKKVKSLPASGSVDATMNKPAKPDGILNLYAAYTDKGGTGIKPLMGSSSVSLSNSTMTFDGVTKMDGFSKVTFGGRTFLIIPEKTSWFRIDSIDLTDISHASLGMGWQKPPVGAYIFELHLDSPQGEKIGEFSFAGVSGTASPNAKPQFATLTSQITPVSDGSMHNVYIVSNPKDPTVSGTAALASLQFFLK